MSVYDVRKAPDLSLVRDGRRLLELLARQDGVTALCLDEHSAPCPMAPEVTELGLSAFEWEHLGSIPSKALRESDRETAFAAILLARSQGVTDAVVHRVDSDDPVTMHVVNMLDEWGVSVIVVGGTLRPLLGLGRHETVQQAPRRLVHRRDRTGHILSVDPPTERLLGWKPEQMVGLSATRFVDPADHERAIEGWIEMLSGGEPEHSRIRYLTASGERRWFEVTLTNLLDRPDAGYVEVELIDVHDEMLALATARLGEAQFQALTESLPVGVIQVGANGRIVSANKSARDVIGDTDQSVADWAGVLEGDGEVVERAFLAAITRQESTDIDVCLISSASARVRQCRLRIRSMGADDEGISRGAIASIEDMTDTLDLHARLRLQVRTDSLTGLSNRLALDEWFQAHANDEASNRGITFMYLDLDGFKRVNDCYGHDTGDNALRMIAERVEKVLEPADMLARIGGDEFVIARAVWLDEEACGQLAQRVLDEFDRLVEVDGQTVTLGCSIGVSRGCGSQSASVMLGQADRAMYCAKQAGGQRWVIQHDT